MASKLRKIFETLSYQQILSIAEEFYFCTDEDTPKAKYERLFADFLVAEGFSDEVISRYREDPGLETNEAEKTIKLFTFQCLNKRDMIIGCDRATTFLNTSEPGTGKTFSTISFAETEKRPMAVICPKSVMLTWYLLSIKAEVEILFICNYEMFITGQMYHFGGNVDLEKLPIVPNPYLTKNKVKKSGRAKEVVTFEWKNLPERSLLVFDEAHMCKNIGTQRTETLLSAYRYASHPENKWKDINIILLSGTIIEKKDNLAPFMYVLGYESSPTAKATISSKDFSVRAFGQQLLAQKRMTRATMKEAKLATNDKFVSDNRVKKFKVTEEQRSKIQKACEEIRNVLKGIEGKKSNNHLAVRLQKRQEIETVKLAILIEETKNLLDQDWGVAIFLNFLPSHETFCSMLKKERPDVSYSVIKGGQTAFERLQQVELWQKKVNRVIVVMIQAGGVGIGLHDVYGTGKCYGLHSPPESATLMVQALGRLDRLGSKSNSVQRIVFVADTIEEQIADSLLKKMTMIGDLNGEEESKTDNIFLFEEIHNYEQKKAEVEEELTKDVDIKLKVDKAKGIFSVLIPDSLVDAFERGLPQAACLNMRTSGDSYQFPLEYRAQIQEYLSNLIQ